MRFKCLPYQLITIWLLLFIPASASAGSHTVFWAPLTDFEGNVLNNTDAARSGDADELLALALVTSGDIRHKKSFDAIQQQVHQFINRYRSIIDGQPSVYAKGHKLLGAMHDTYFNRHQTKRARDLVGGYDAEQSKVSAIFTTGQFNCVSSAILYIILGRYFDLNIHGVVTSQHAFVQIQTPKNQIIEVETTSRNGYGQNHDKQFYEQHFAAFSRSRNLRMPTYQDYLNRRVLSPFMLIVNNMNNQHTHAGRMDESTRHRLFEIQGYLDSDNAASQINRLGVYQNNMIALLNARKNNAANALIRIVEPVVAQIKKRPWINDTRKKEIQTVRDRLGAIHTLWGHISFLDKHYTIAERQYREALQWARSEAKQNQAYKNIYKAQAFRAFKDNKWQEAIGAYQKLLSQLKPAEKALVLQTRNNIVASYWNWGSEAENRSKWMAAAGHYDAISQWTKNEQTLKKAKAAKACALARHNFQARRWADAILYFEEALTFQDPERQAATHRSIESAYINWGNTHLKAKKYQLALEKYEMVLPKAIKESKKVIHNNVMAACRSLTAHLVREKKYAEASALAKSILKRFPDCRACRREVSRLMRLGAKQPKPK